MGVVAVAQGCCEASLQSDTEQWESFCVLSSAAVHWSCINAHLDEEQISIGVVAVGQGCCEASLQSDTEQWEKLLCPDQFCSALVVHQCTLG